ncbi:MAG: adenylate/guanylate cyclase domain-containing protein [Pseudomonadota bacterium]
MIPDPIDSKPRMGERGRGPATRTLSISWMVVLINVGCNLVGFFIVQIMLHFACPFFRTHGGYALDPTLNALLLAFIVPAAVVVIHRLARPVQDAISILEKGEPLSGRQLEAARRRAVNLPFHAALMNLIAWVLPAVSFPLELRFEQWASVLHILVEVLYSFTNAVMITLFGLIILEEYCRRSLFPVLFPNGRIRDQTGTVTLTIRDRLMLVYAAICLIPMFQAAIIINTNASLTPAAANPQSLLKEMALFSTMLFAFVAVYGLWLAILAARNLAEPAEDMTVAADRIAQGDYGARAKVVSNDEIGHLGDRVNEMARGLKERERIREIFHLFMSPEIGREVLSGRSFEQGQMRHVTLLFSDLRGFTAMAERLPPQQVLESINAYYEAMTDAIVENSGIVLQYVGDEIEAVFGAPLDDPLHPDNAVDAALAMRARLALLNADRNARGEPPLMHGIGIHTGTVLAGLVGSRHKISYALVGDAVNLASRIEGLTKELGGDILVSGDTFRALSRARSTTGPLTVPVRGKTDGVELYHLVG